MKEKINLENISGGSSEVEAWICPFCGRTIMVRRVDEKMDHFDKCPNNPEPDWRSDPGKRIKYEWLYF